VPQGWVGVAFEERVFAYAMANPKAASHTQRDRTRGGVHRAEEGGGEVGDEETRGGWGCEGAPRDEVERGGAGVVALRFRASGWRERGMELRRRSGGGLLSESWWRCRAE
jgi:hypothetical protein